MRAMRWIGRLLRGCGAIRRRFGADFYTAPQPGWAFEPLERRVLLTADVTGGLLTITGTADNDTIEIAPGLLAGEVIVLRAPGVDNGTVLTGVDAISIDAGDGNDRITVRAGILSTLATSIDATIIGGAGNDRITGGDGNDLIFGDDMVLGGNGDDNIVDLLGSNTIVAGDGRNRITTGDGNDIITGGLDDDRVTDSGGTNVIATGGGDDRVTTGEGDDTLTTGDGDDRITDRGGVNSIDAGEDDNRISTGDGDDTLTTGSGEDRITDRGGINIINTGGGDDRVATGDGADTITTGDGNDRISDRGGANTIDTGAGDDRVTIGDGDDEVELADGDDRLADRGGNNTVRAGAGEDNIRTGNGDDDVEGGDDDDTLNSGRGDDRVRGGDGLDRIRVNDSAGDDVSDEPPNVVNESENNDREQRGDVFGLGGDGAVQLIGVSTSDDDKDFFTFVAEVDGMVQFIVDAPGGQFAQLRISEEAGPGLPDIDIDETEPNDGDFDAQATVVAGRTYYLRLRSTNDDPADYVVNVSRVGESGGGGGDPGEPVDNVSETETNDIKAAADLAPLGSNGIVQIAGTSLNNDDKDFFRFTAENSGTLDIVVNSGNGVFAEVDVEAADGAKILETDPDDGVNTASGTIVAGVTYFVRVRAPGDVPADYSVDLTLTPIVT